MSYASANGAIMLPSPRASGVLHNARSQKPGGSIDGLRLFDGRLKKAGICRALPLGRPRHKDSGTHPALHAFIKRMQAPGLARLYCRREVRTQAVRRIQSRPLSSMGLGEASVVAIYKRARESCCATGARVSWGFPFPHSQSHVDRGCCYTFYLRCAYQLGR